MQPDFSWIRKYRQKKERKQGRLKKRKKCFDWNIITFYFCRSHDQAFCGVLFPVDFKPQCVVRFIKKKKKSTTHKRMVSMCQPSCTSVVSEIWSPPPPPPAIPYTLHLPFFAFNHPSKAAGTGWYMAFWHPVLTDAFTCSAPFLPSCICLIFPLELRTCLNTLAFSNFHDTMKCELWMMQSWWGSLSVSLVSIQINLAIFTFFFPWFISVAIFLAIFLEKNHDFSIPSGYCCSSDLLLKFSEFSFFPCLKFLLHINKVSQETSGHMWYFRFILHAPHRHCHETTIPVPCLELSLFGCQWIQGFFCIGLMLFEGQIVTFRWHLNHCGCVRLFFSFASEMLLLLNYINNKLWVPCGEV